MHRAVGFSPRGAPVSEGAKTFVRPRRLKPAARKDGSSAVILTRGQRRVVHRDVPYGLRLQVSKARLLRGAGGLLRGAGGLLGLFFLGDLPQDHSGSEEDDKLAIRFAREDRGQDDKGRG